MATVEHSKYIIHNSHDGAPDTAFVPNIDIIYIIIPPIICIFDCTNIYIYIFGVIIYEKT